MGVALYRFVSSHFKPAPCPNHHALEKSFDKPNRAGVWSVKRIKWRDCHPFKMQVNIADNSKLSRRTGFFRAFAMLAPAVISAAHLRIEA